MARPALPLALSPRPSLSLSGTSLPLEALEPTSSSRLRAPCIAYAPPRSEAARVPTLHPAPVAELSSPLRSTPEFSTCPTDMQPFPSFMRHPATAVTAATVTFLAGWATSELLLIALVLIRAAMRRKHRTGIARKPTANLWGAAKRRPLSQLQKLSPEPTHT